MSTKQNSMSQVTINDKLELELVDNDVDETVKPVGGRLATDKILNAIFAGDCKFTIFNTKENIRYTYHITECENPKGCNQLYFINLLTGPDIWRYFGCYRDRVYSHDKKFDKEGFIGEQALSVRYLKAMIRLVEKNELPSYIEVWHEGKCCKCGRTLTTPQSIEDGIGPVCRSVLSKKGKW